MESGAISQLRLREHLGGGGVLPSGGLNVAAGWNVFRVRPDLTLSNGCVMIYALALITRRMR
jgi:hypothetical protein